MLPDKEIQLFKKSFIDNEHSETNLIILKNSLCELNDPQAEDLLSKYIDEKLSLLKS